MPGVIENLLGVFNIQDYGAKPDGRDITLRWIDALAALPAGGGTIVFPPGAYQLNSNLSWQGLNNVTVWLTAGVTFIGPGSLPANSGTNRVIDLSGVSGTFPPSGPAGGALSGNYPNPAIAAPAAPTTSAVGDAAAAGVATTPAATDHRHGREAFGAAAVTQAFGDTAATGAAATPARSDHRHGMPGSPVNHSVNGLLNIWQRTVQAYTASGGSAGPDRLFISLAGTDTISCTQDTANVDAADGAHFDLACAFTLGTGAGASNVQEVFKTTTDNFGHFRGKTITRSWMVRSNVANAVRIGLGSDGTGGSTSYSAYHPGDGAWHLLTVSYAVPTNATAITAGVYFAASGTHYVGAHATALGAVAPDPYLAAVSPGDDMARCCRYYQRVYVTTRVEATGANQYANCPIAFHVPMVVTPSVTFGTPDASVNMNTPTATFISANGGAVTGTSNAAGDAAWSGLVALEANP